jgi:protein-tyrosine phosphatase
MKIFNAQSAIFMAMTIMLVVSCNKEESLSDPNRAGILEGAPNFRDLGGYSSANGKQTTWRKVFRSQALASLTDGDVKKVTELGIKTVIDFRGDGEVSQGQSRLPEGVNIVRLSIDAGNLSDGTDIMQLLMTGALDSTQGVGYMQAINRKLVTECVPQYRAFFETLLQPENYPLVFHCTAGKDRTGFAAALLLSALDVNWDTVMSDYLLTNQYYTVEQGAVPDEVMPVFRLIGGVHFSYLNAAKDEIVKHYGSVDNYLREELNVGDEERKQLMQYILN